MSVDCCLLAILAMGDGDDERDAAQACTPDAAGAGTCRREQSARDRAAEAQSTAAQPHSLAYAFNFFGNVSTTAPMFTDLKAHVEHDARRSAAAFRVNFFDDLTIASPPGVAPPMIPARHADIGKIMHSCVAEITTVQNSGPGVA